MAQVTLPPKTKMAALAERQDRWHRRWMSHIGALTVASAKYEHLSPDEFWQHENAFIERVRNQVIKVLTPDLNKNGNSFVLEYGIGAAHLSGDASELEIRRKVEAGDIAAIAVMLGFNFLGIDFAASAVEVAKKNILKSFQRKLMHCRPEELVQCMPAHELTAGERLKPSSVALILAVRFLIHLPKDELRQVIAAWSTLLQPGGYIIIAQPDVASNEGYRKNKFKNEYSTIWSVTEDIIPCAKQQGLTLQIQSSAIFQYIEEWYGLWVLKRPY